MHTHRCASGSHTTSCFTTQVGATHRVPAQRDRLQPRPQCGAVYHEKSMAGFRGLWLCLAGGRVQQRAPVPSGCPPWHHQQRRLGAGGARSQARPAPKVCAARLLNKLKARCLLGTCEGHAALSAAQQWSAVCSSATGTCAQQ